MNEWSFQVPAASNDPPGEAGVSQCATVRVERRWAPFGVGADLFRNGWRPRYECVCTVQEYDPEMTRIDGSVGCFELDFLIGVEVNTCDHDLRSRHG